MALLTGYSSGTKRAGEAAWRRTAGLLTGCLLLLSAGGAGRARESRRPALGYVRAVPGELPADAAARHARVAQRRAGPGIIVHRGATSYAPENTLEAYSA